MILGTSRCQDLNSEIRCGGHGKCAHRRQDERAGRFAMRTKNIAEKSMARKGSVDLTRAQDRVDGTPLLGRKSVLMGIVASGFVAANVAHPSSASAGTIKPVAAPQPAYVFKWAPATAYSVGQQVISPNNDVVSANVAHTSSAAFATDSAKWTLSASYARQEIFVNVLALGVKGDGTTDDTLAINAAIAANPGKVLLFPGGRTYQIRADLSGGGGHGGGITLNKAGTVLWLYGATIRMITSSFANYQMIDVTAPGCSVLGGTLIGDEVAHTGTTGEWGFGVSIGAGADHFTARDMYVTKCWGDGFFIWERPCEVSLTNCTGDDNRRQGLSIIDALRPQVTGGAYTNNGLTKYTAPGGGIDLEPDPGTARDVIDAVITGVTLSGNRGPGLWTSSNGRTVTATITGCRAIGNGAAGSDSGFLVDGVGNRSTFNSCEANSNSKDGWTIGAGVGVPSKTKLNSCTAQLNARFGIIDDGIATQITGGAVEDNGGTGLFLESGDCATVLGLSARGNCTAGVTNVQVDICSTNASLNGVKSLCGTNTTLPAYGFAVRSGATAARLMGCDSSAGFTGGSFIDQTTGATAVTLPVPGATRAAAIAAPAAPGTTYSQASEASLKAAVDAIRTALKSHGITA
jgi:hypothetical protein